MVTGVERYNSKGQGKRSGGCIQGSMSAMIYGTTESIVLVSEENVRKHFDGIWNYKPTYMRMGDQSRIQKEDVLSKLNINLNTDKQNE